MYLRYKMLNNLLAMKQIFRFHNVPGLYVDMDGIFHHDTKKVKKVCNNGSLSIQVGSTKHGAGKLRKNAYKDFIDDFKLPF
jgi:hypothetical protein